jgi:hypothetical protein
MTFLRRKRPAVIPTRSGGIGSRQDYSVHHGQIETTLAPDIERVESRWEPLDEPLPETELWMPDGQTRAKGLLDSELRDEIDSRLGELYELTAARSLQDPAAECWAEKQRQRQREPWISTDKSPRRRTDVADGLKSVTSEIIDPSGITIGKDRAT